MNNTIAWILTAFVIVTIILDLSTFILMKTNNKAYKQNGKTLVREKRTGHISQYRDQLSQ